MVVLLKCRSQSWPYWYQTVKVNVDRLMRNNGSALAKYLQALVITCLSAPSLQGVTPHLVLQ